jgi:proteic killer suppression protein
MIRSFGDKQAEALFDDQCVPGFQGIGDLAVPPSNRLEKLRGDLEGFYSIRINDQWRLIFKWSDGEATEVRIVDYH